MSGIRPGQTGVCFGGNPQSRDRKKEQERNGSCQEAVQLTLPHHPLALSRVESLRLAPGDCGVLIEICMRHPKRLLRCCAALLRGYGESVADAMGRMCISNSTEIK